MATTQTPLEIYKLPLAEVYKAYNYAKKGRLSRELSREVRRYVEEVLEKRRRKLRGVAESIRVHDRLGMLLGKALRLSHDLRISFLRDREGSWAHELSLDVSLSRERFIEPYLEDWFNEASRRIREYFLYLRRIAAEAAFRRYVRVRLKSEDIEAHRPMMNHILAKDEGASRVEAENLRSYLFAHERYPLLLRFLRGKPEGFDTRTLGVGLLEAALKETSRGSRIRALLEELRASFYRLYTDRFVVDLLAARAEELGFSIVQRSTKHLVISVEPFGQANMRLKYLHAILRASGIRAIKIYIKRPYRRDRDDTRKTIVERLSSIFDRRYEHKEIETLWEPRLEELQKGIMERFYYHDLHVRFEVFVREDVEETRKLRRLQLLVLIALLILRVDRLLYSRLLRELFALIPFFAPLLRVLYPSGYRFLTLLEDFIEKLAPSVERTPGRVVLQLRDPPPAG